METVAITCPVNPTIGIFYWCRHEYQSAEKTDREKEKESENEEKLQQWR